MSMRLHRTTRADGLPLLAVVATTIASGLGVAPRATASPNHFWNSGIGSAGNGSGKVESADMGVYPEVLQPRNYASGIISIAVF